MKTITKILILSGLVLGLYSCKQNLVSPDSTVASFNVVDANVGSASLFVNIFNQPVVYSKFTTSNYITYGKSNVYSPIAGTNPISFTQSTDTLNRLFQANFSFQKNDSYTFFLTGTKTQPDTVLIHENLPARTDSTAGIRFINLSPGANPISVNIKGQANGSEVQSLAYKKYTTFKSYKADHTVATYVFEFRDQATGTLLFTYTLSGVNTQSSTVVNNVLFRNITLALIGQPAGGTVAQSVILVPNY